MINIKSLKKDYDKLKNQSRDSLMISDLREVIKFKRKLTEAINELKEIIEVLNNAQEYGQTISTARAKIKGELKDLEVLEKTL